MTFGKYNTSSFTDAVELCWTEFDKTVLKLPDFFEINICYLSAKEQRFYCRSLDVVYNIYISCV